MDRSKDIADQLKEVIAGRESGNHIDSGSMNLLLADALYNIEKQRKALTMAADRFDDLGTVIDEGGKYDNAGFMRASARRCRELDF